MVVLKDGKFVGAGHIMIVKQIMNNNTEDKKLSEKRKLLQKKEEPFNSARVT